MPASLSPGMPNMIQDTRVKFECQTNNTWYEHPLYNIWDFFFFLLLLSVVSRNLIGPPRFSLTKSGDRHPPGTPPGSKPVPTAGEAPRAAPAQSRSHAGRPQPGNAATKGAREVESFHMPDQWGRGDGGANRPETAAQRGGPSPSIDPSPLWLRQRERRLVGTRPILIRGEGPQGPLAPSP